MPFSPSPEQRHTLLHEADAAARRLIRQLRLSRHDLEDIRQDLITDALARMPAFQAERGSVGAFLATVMTHRATRIMRRVIAERRMFGFEPMSIDMPIKDGEADTLADTIASDAGLGAVWGQAGDGATSSIVRLDIERCLGTLERQDARLCAALTTRSVDELAAEGHGSRAGLYRRIQTLRGSILARGLAAA
jgi:RNA polymerase sigma-70 factor (ECF subfamily)